MSAGPLDQLPRDPRVTVRRKGPPDTEGQCVVYWMQRSQRAVDNPALDVAIEACNALRKPVVAFLGLVPFYPNANLRQLHIPCRGASRPCTATGTTRPAGADLLATIRIISRQPRQGLRQPPVFGWIMRLREAGRRVTKGDSESGEEHGKHTFRGSPRGSAGRPCAY